MLDEVKTLLGFPLTDYSQDKKLEVIMEIVRSHLQILAGVSEIPSELEFIVDEVTVKRFNRIGSEGFSSHTVEGETVSLESSDFDAYLPVIDAWKISQKGSPGSGRIRFL